MKVVNFKLVVWRLACALILRRPCIVCLLVYAERRLRVMSGLPNYPQLAHDLGPDSRCNYLQRFHATQS